MGCQPALVTESIGLDDLTRLVTTLRDIITQQSSVIDTVRADLTEIRSQNAKLQQEV
jgi:hypothetical protein